MIENLNLISIFLQILGIPLVILGLFFSVRTASRSRDLQTALILSADFRTRWEGEWKNPMLILAAGGTLNEEQADSFAGFLNWLDWLGYLLKADLLTNKEVILGTIRPTICDALKYASAKIEQDKIKYDDVNYWGGLEYLRTQISI